MRGGISDNVDRRMVRTLLAFVAVAAVGGMAACSSAADPIDPPQGCRDFFDAWCNQNASCRPPSERARYVEDCHFVNGLEVDCTRTKALGSTYDACMASITRATCDTYVEGMGLPFPPSCKGILLR
jgi:hypothetical protein